MTATAIPIALALFVKPTWLIGAKLLPVIGGWIWPGLPPA